MPPLSSSDGQLFDLSEPAAQLSQTLTNALDDSAGDAPASCMPSSSSVVHVLVQYMVEREAHRSESLWGVKDSKKYSLSDDTLAHNCRKCHIAP